jgi:hypothetical protein
MFSLWTLGPLHNRGSRRRAFRVHKLPVAGELARGQPLRQRLGRYFLRLGLGGKQLNGFLVHAIKQTG